ncbi:MAG: ABC transporter permease [Oscillospiraceae bacterium]|nr:ABC transporter permease [Oscillospiraceae bacterium]MBR0450631.1 ABC transporter permease [Oscillospiraceae bacterium]MDO5137095.1 ABC transporter permease [Oscillospiraceae bacterium]
MSSKNTYDTVRVKNRNSRFVDVVKRYVRNKAAVVGALIFLVILFVIIFADFIVPKEMITAYDMKQKMLPPCKEHPFGTDNIGRDVFARIIHGSRITVGIGVGSTLASLIIGATIASICALFKSVDFVVMRIIDILTCVPSILLALVILAAFGGSVPSMIFTLTFVSIPGFVITIRSILLRIVEEDYVKAARLSGSPTWKLAIKHIIPNAMDEIIVDATMTIAGMMMSAAGLSFIGMGIKPPSPEWGAMLNFARDYFRTAPYLSIIPGFAIALTALSINLIGDGLRDALDPKSLK